MKVHPTTKELIEMLYKRLPELFDRAAPVQEPSNAQIALLDPWMRPAAAKELLTQVLALGTPAQPAPVVQEPAAWIDSVMEQAQVFASAWSLVGGRFDSGNGLEDAEQAKAELRAMLITPPAAQRQWVGLTDDEKQWIKESEWTTDELVEWMNTKLKEKNT